MPQTTKILTPAWEGEGKQNVAGSEPARSVYERQQLIHSTTKNLSEDSKEFDNASRKVYQVCRHDPRQKRVSCSPPLPCTHLHTFAPKAAAIGLVVGEPDPPNYELSLSEVSDCQIVLAGCRLGLPWESQERSFVSLTVHIPHNLEGIAMEYKAFIAAWITVRMIILRFRLDL